MDEPEIDQTSKVDGGDPGREAHLVLLDAAESDAPVVVAHEPCDRTFDHRAILSIVRNEVAVAPRATGLDELGIASSERELASVLGESAARPKRAVRAAVPEYGVALRGDRDDVTRRR